MSISPVEGAKHEYDLIVVGSDPEGIAAAISGARNGLDTLLVDTRPEVGGLMTRGWLNTIDMNYAPNPYGPKYEILNKGIFLEFYKQVEGDSFDVNTARRVFNRMIAREDNLRLLLNARQIEPIVTKKYRRAKVEGIKVVNAEGETERYYCKRLIDATQDADIAARAGVPFSFGQEDMGYKSKTMAVTLVFKLAGITDRDWLKIRRVLNTDDDIHTGANSVSAWGFKEIMEKYQFKNPRLGVRGLNIGRQNDGSVLINALHIYHVDPLDPEARKEARLIALKELPALVEYIKENVPGFENAYLAEVAPELYVRESRHIYAEYRLTVDDVLENRDFYDRVAFGSYPVDVQATDRENTGFVVGNPKQYAVPFRCLVPKKVDNMLVVGRSAGFDSLAHGSARVIPVGMATGQAAGAAAAISIDKDISFRKMAQKKYIMSDLQDILNKQGMDIKPFAVKTPLREHWAYEGLKFVRRHGLASGEYFNDYRLDEPVTAAEFAEILLKLGEIYNFDLPEKIERYAGVDKELTVDDLEDIFSEKWIKKQPVWEKIVENDEGITRGAAFVLLKNYVQQAGR
nr:FAD-dependent oxidoreductase [Desulforadius tongensis]